MLIEDLLSDCKKCHFWKMFHRKITSILSVKRIRKKFHYGQCNLEFPCLCKFIIFAFGHSVIMRLRGTLGWGPWGWRFLRSSGHLAAGLPAEAGGDDPPGLEQPLHVHPGVYPGPLAHVHHVLSAHVPAGAPGVGAASEASCAAVHCADPELEAGQDVGQGLIIIIIIITLISHH